MLCRIVDTSPLWANGRTSIIFYRLKNECWQTVRVSWMSISWCVFAMLATHTSMPSYESRQNSDRQRHGWRLYTPFRPSARKQSAQSGRDESDAVFRRLEEQLHSISRHSPSVTRRSLHQRSFVTLVCNSEQTFQSTNTSVRSFAVDPTIFGSFGQFDHRSLWMFGVMGRSFWRCLLD